MSREECALNFTLIGMCKANELGFMHPGSSINLDCFFCFISILSLLDLGCWKVQGIIKKIHWYIQFSLFVWLQLTTNITEHVTSITTIKLFQWFFNKFFHFSTGKLIINLWWRTPSLWDRTWPCHHFIYFFGLNDFKSGSWLGNSRS